MNDVRALYMLKTLAATFHHKAKYDYSFTPVEKTCIQPMSNNQIIPSAHSKFKRKHPTKTRGTGPSLEGGGATQK